MHPVKLVAQGYIIAEGLFHYMVVHPVDRMTRGLLHYFIMKPVNSMAERLRHCLAVDQWDARSMKFNLLLNSTVQASALN